MWDLEKREDRPQEISIFKEEGEEKQSPKQTKVKSQPGEHADTDARARAWVAINTAERFSELRTEMRSVNLIERKSPQRDDSRQLNFNKVMQKAGRLKSLSK